MSQTILSIDIGTYSLKCLRLERRVQELKILNYFEESLTPYARLPHEEQVAECLKKLFEAQLLDADVTCMSLPGQFLSSRILELPVANTKKINQIIDFELENHIPFPAEDIFSDYHILSQTGNQVEVLCVYLQNERLKKYIEAFSQIGVEPKYLGADFTDLSGISNIAMVPRDDYYAICDIGHTKTNLIIMEGNQIRYARTIGIGGHNFTRAIQRMFNLNFEKADALKLSRGKLFVREDDSDQVSRILNRVAKELVVSMRQTFFAARNYYPKLSVPAIYCCGGGSRMLGLMDYLSFHLRTNVFDLDVLNYVSHDFEDPEKINCIIPQVLATAVRPIFSNRVTRVNFRKGPYAFKQDLQLVWNEFKSVAAMMLVILFLGVGYYFYADYYYSNKISEIEKKVEKLGSGDVIDLKLPPVKKDKGGTPGKLVEKYLDAAQKRITELKSQSSPDSEGEDIVQVLYDISSSLPPKSEVNFEVNEFNFTDDFVKIAASTMTSETSSVDKIVSALTQSDKFEKIEASDVDHKPNNRDVFTLKISMKK